MGCHLPYVITQYYLLPDTSQTGQYFIYLPWRDTRPRWPVTDYIPRRFTRPQMQVLTQQQRDQKKLMRWSQVQHPNHYTTKLMFS